MEDKSYLLKVGEDVVRVRAAKRPDKETIEALTKMVLLVKKKLTSQPQQL